jgi:hypothetical protein
VGYDEIEESNRAGRCISTRFVFVFCKCFESYVLVAMFFSWIREVWIDVKRESCLARNMTKSTKLFGGAMSLSSIQVGTDE